jgi:uncharacterized phage protein (TIGR02220 family)
MPRIRTLKPEHRQHRKVGPLDHVTYRLWVGMILEADDEGRFVYDPDALRVLIFGYHPRVSRAIVDASASLLESVGLIRRYLANGQTYACFPSWRDHQRLDHPTPSKLPEPNDSVNVREDSANARENSRGIGKERIGKERSTTLSGAAPDDASRNGPDPTGTAHRLLDFLNRKTGRNYQPVASNIELIRARLREGATEGQCRAIIGRQVAAWAADPRMARYLRPLTLFNREKFAQYQGELPASAFEEPTT